jgi:plastocyanin
MADTSEQSREQSQREWTLVVVGLAGLTSVIALILSIFALASSGSSTATAATPATPTVANPIASSAPPPKAQTLHISVKADDEHGRRGPDGKWHDAFLPADFTVHAGAQVTVTVDNYDGGPHSFTSPSMGVNQIIPGGGSMSSPQQVTFRFTAPKKPGHYQWWCAVPCDPWAMAHNGYMRGIVTVSA